jgi:hypothetical protein
MTSDPQLNQQIQFARHNFDNHQALIRASDAKAGVLVTLMVFLAASSLQVSKDAVGKLRWSPCCPLILSALFVVACIGLAVAVIWSLVTVQRVLKPRGAAHYRAPQKDRDLMWQDHVLLHGTNQEYGAAVRGATEELILQNLTNQVFELAHISKEKMDALRGARWAAYLAFISWAGSITSSLILLKLK